MAVLTALQKKSLDRPDDVRTLPKTRVEVCQIGDQTLMRVTFEPGWKWSQHVKPTAGTDWCEVAHCGYVISGSMKVVLKDGHELDLKAGDFLTIPPGHDGWVLGNQPAVVLDFVGGEHYGKKR